MVNLRHKLLIEQQDRQRLEDTFLKREDELGKLRYSFDRSLNTITGDARNLKTILDGSLNKLEKHLMTAQGVAATDSEVTSGDEVTTVPPSKVRSKANANGIHVPSKLDKYLPATGGQEYSKASNVNERNTDRNNSAKKKTKSSSHAQYSHNEMHSKSKTSAFSNGSALHRPVRTRR